MPFISVTFVSEVVQRPECNLDRGELSAVPRSGCGPGQAARDRPASGGLLCRHTGKRGAYRGHKPSLSPERAAELNRRAQAGELKSRLAREFGVSRETLHQDLREVA